MIQRFQTILLTVAFILLGLLFFLPMAKLPTGEAIPFVGYWPFLALIILCTLATFFTISLFRHRILQIRLCTINAVLCLAFQVWVLIYFLEFREAMSFKIAAVFPAVAMILIILAIRYIAADEAMVRSYERLRGGKHKKRS